MEENKKDNKFNIKNKKKVTIISLLVVLTIICIGTFIYKYKTDILKHKEITLELGNEFKIEDVIKDRIDISEVTANVDDLNIYTTGTYKVPIKYGKVNKTVTVKVVDSSNPEAEANTEIVVGTNRALFVSECISKLEETSGFITATFDDYLNDDNEPTIKNNGIYIVGNSSMNGDSAIVYDKAGNYKNGITIVDSENNSVHIDINIKVVNAPEITGTKNISIKPGENYNFADGIKAIDSDGNDISDKIVINTDDLDENTEGTYKVAYIVTDDNGIQSNAVSLVTVSNDGMISDGEGNKEIETPSGNKITVNSNAWKYDLSYALTNYRSGYWADGTNMTMDEINDIYEGNNIYGAKYLVDGGGMTIQEYNSVYNASLNETENTEN